jgi:serine phosphatase RsbU (regulator of sigma subunit)
LKFNFRLKIIIGFITIALISVVLLQLVSKQYVQGILLNQLFQNMNIFPEIISTSEEAIKWNNDLLLANKIIQLTQMEDVKSIVLIENDRVFISNISNDIGSEFKIDYDDYIPVEDYFVKYYENEMHLMKEFSYSDEDDEQQSRNFYILMILDTSKIFEAITELNKKLILLGLGIVFYGITLAIPFGGIFSKRILRISEAARNIGKGDLSHKISINNKYLYDEIDELASEINIMVENLKNAEKLKLEQEIMKQELTIATQIQQALLPKKNPDFSFLETGSFYQAAKEVGGDYFDWIIIDDEHLGIVMADVSGKGIPGSLVMTMTRNILKVKATTILDPEQVLKEVNEVLQPDLKRGMFVTVWYGVLNLKTFKLEFSNAGHSPLLVYRAKENKLEEYKLRGMPLGIAKKNRFNKVVEKKEIFLDINDILFQYTDGISEAYDKNENLFGDEKLKEVFLNNSNKKFGEIIDAIIDAIKEHTQGAEQSDDIAMIGLKLLNRGENKDE